MLDTKKEVTDFFRDIRNLPGMTRLHSVWSAKDRSPGRDLVRIPVGCTPRVC